MSSWHANANPCRSSVRTVAAAVLAASKAKASAAAHLTGRNQSTNCRSSLKLLCSE
jgi:hypothetical protein